MENRPNKSRSAAKLNVVRAANGSWELLHPHCATTRSEDLEEVQQMIAAGETEIAQDELRWLLSECHDFLAAHKLLGDLALVADDIRLARGHYGYAYQLGQQAIDRAGPIQPLPYAKIPNQPFFQAGRGLILCLQKQGKHGLANDVIARLLQLDQTDPLGLRALHFAKRGKRRNKNSK